MKRIFSNLSKFTVLLIIIAIAASCTKQPANTASAPATTGAKKEAIVFVNSDSLLENYNYFKSIRTKLEGKSKKAETDLNAKGTAFQREVTAYQQAAQTMSTDQRASTEERLARKQQELQAFNQNAGNALASEQAAENEKLYEKVAEFLKKYSKEKGYKMVLTYSKANPTVLFADASLDVTKEVVTRLNEEYKKEQK